MFHPVAGSCSNAENIVGTSEPAQCRANLADLNAGPVANEPSSRA